MSRAWSRSASGGSEQARPLRHEERRGSSSSGYRGVAGWVLVGAACLRRLRLGRLSDRLRSPGRVGLTPALGPLADRATDVFEWLGAANIGDDVEVVLGRRREREPFER